MIFEIDKQTINDLELFETSKGKKSVISYFSYTKSIGGKELLRKMFSNPLTDINLIEERIEFIKYFQNKPTTLEFDKEGLDMIEYYLTRQIDTSTFSILQSYLKAIKNAFIPSNEYYILQRGVKYLIVSLFQLYVYASKIDDSDRTPTCIKHLKESIIETIDNTSLKAVLEIKERQKFLPHEYARLNLIFRRNEFRHIRRLIDITYEIDVYNSLAFAAQKHGFSLPAFENGSNCLEIKSLFHPFLENPVKNDFSLISAKRVCFITGPNMAGKSTFLKALSISIYLAHLGFPVPASDFRTSLFNGLLTTVNLPDNIGNGYSHYYNEVLRIKHVANKLNELSNLFIVFDELFRGTNIKDAYEASLAVINEFSKLNNSVFAISTHIIEVADKLKEIPSIFFKYFEANLIDETPHYNYLLKDGITNERIGMYILKKEKVLETINNKFK